MKLLFFIFLFSSGAYAQRGLVLDALDQNVINDDLLNSRYGKISGSPYYNEEFTIGTVKYINNTIETNVLVRLDLYGRSVQIKRDNEVIEYDNKQVVEVSLLNSKTAEIINFKNIKVNNNTILVLAYFEEEIKFYGVTNVEKRVSTSTQTGYSSSDQQDKFVKSESYYLLFKNEYSKVKLSKKAFLAVVGEDEKILEFLKKNKTKFNRMEDIVGFLKYVNNEI